MADTEDAEVEIWESMWRGLKGIFTLRHIRLFLTGLFLVGIVIIPVTIVIFMSTGSYMAYTTTELGLNAQESLLLAALFGLIFSIPPAYFFTYYAILEEKGIPYWKGTGE